jgi:protein MpaA
MFRLGTVGGVVVVALLAGAIATGGPSPRRPDLAAGRSAQGRTIGIITRGSPKGQHRILVIGCIHGDECAGTAIANWLAHARPERNTRLWIIRNLNPDGYAARRRQNGHGVDLNRNFPWHWQAAGRAGDLHYPGPHALSEPESRYAVRLIKEIKPQLTIWFHQPLGVVDDSGGRRALARRYARLVGLPLVRLPRYAGGATSWQNHLYPNTSLVVELPPGHLTRTRAARYGHAVLDLLGPT